MACDLAGSWTRLTRLDLHRSPHFCCYFRREMRAATILFRIPMHQGLRLPSRQHASSQIYSVHIGGLEAVP